MYRLVIDPNAGYWRPDDTRDLSTLASYFRVAKDSAMAIGFSATAVFILFIVALAVAALPVAFSLRKLPGAMVSGGSNSLVLFAACHANGLGPFFSDLYLWFTKIRPRIEGSR